MAITTLDGALANMIQPTLFSKGVSGALVAGKWFTPLYTAGIPSAATAYAGGLNGVTLTSLSGQIPFPSAVGGESVYLSRFSGSSSAQGGMLILADRLWHNSIAVTTTTAQAIVSPSWPARDRTGATTGVGVYIALEISATVGIGAATPSISYTNTAGTTGRTGTMTYAYDASSIVGRMFPFTLAAGDDGVKSVESVTLNTSMTSGTAGLVAFRPIATLEFIGTGLPNAIDSLTGGFPICYDNTVPMLIFVPSTTSTTLLQGQVVFSQG